MTLTKKDISDSIYDNCGFSKTQSINLTETVLEIIKNRLISGEDVLISGFGRFCLNGKNERRGRNPATGNDLILKARRVITFRCSGVLKDKMNGKG